jgi:hypothetical protein
MLTTDLHFQIVLIGVPVDKALKYCSDKGILARIESLDGYPQAFTDRDPERLNLTVVNNIVTKVRWG